MTRTDEGRDLLRGSLLAGVFAAMTALVAIDLISDVRAGTTAFHAALEGFVIALGFIATGSLVLRARRLARDAHELREQASALAARLQASQQEAERWRSDTAELVAGLGAAIDQQLTRWELSPAEREIALLLLKGLSHKEIASLRDVNETTVRQQARALYRKAGLSGRNDLAAFFLEDLLGPRGPAP
jgi:DNA-binding NarL/FixJ family response regulator